MKSITTQQQEVLIGSMLGDGHLEGPRGPNGNASFKIARKNTDEDYLRWEADIFKEFLSERGVFFTSSFDKRTQKTYHQVVLRTKSDPIFTYYHSVWYKNKIKIVPSDLKLTPLILAIWIADDGYVYHYTSRKKGNTKGREYFHVLHLKIATQGFSYIEVKFLESKIRELTGAIGKIYTEKNNQSTIRYHGDNAIKIYRIIDPIFPPLLRKSDIWRRPEAKLWENDKIFVCPYCFNEKVYKNGHTNCIKKIQKYQCLKCKKQFIKPLLEKDKIL